MKTAVEWYCNEMESLRVNAEINNMDAYKFIIRRAEIFTQAKAMEKEQSHLYAEFAIRCDRKDMKILNFEDWIKLETFKSE